MLWPPMTIAAIIVLAVAVVVLASAVVRLENHRYANFVGLCTEFDITNPRRRVERNASLCSHADTWLWGNSRGGHGFVCQELAQGMRPTF
jgi:hypothetical protein